jgi:uncharacterized membrane protein
VAVLVVAEDSAGEAASAAAAAASAAAARLADGDLMNRILTHLTTTGRALRRTFPPESLAAITEATRTAELSHSGEVCVAIESSLDVWQLYRGLTSRQRAIEVFSELRVWDTERNTGVLIYVLLAEHALEIVADRGIAERVPAVSWETLCTDLQTSFRDGDFRDGSIDVIGRISALLAEHLDADDENGNELADTPSLL